MSIRRASWVGLGIVLAAAGCGGTDEELNDGVFTAEEWAKVQTLSPLPERPPADTTNKYADDPKAAVLGQQFFFEKGYSGPITVGNDGSNGGLGMAGETGKISCASCHEGEWMIDLHSKPNNASLGSEWLPRNANSVVNAAYYTPWIENDGLSDSMWADALVDPEFPLAMNGTRLKVVHVVFDKYQAEYNDVFDPDLDASIATLPPDGKPGMPEFDMLTMEQKQMVNTVFVNFGKAIHAYMRLLVSGNSAFDRYVAGGDTGAISPSAKNGLKLFVGKANCVECHKGSHFSDDKFHVIGLTAKGANIVPEETGREAVIGYILNNPFNSSGEYSDDKNTGRLNGLMASEAERGKWRTKGLRNAAMTGPYMHTGQLTTLEDVVKHYNGGGEDGGFVGTKDKAIRDLNLTDTEIKDIVAFLETLTGDVVPAALRTDTSKK
jgi:cytochrome c peroxidase